MLPITDIHGAGASAPEPTTSRLSPLVREGQVFRAEYADSVQIAEPGWQLFLDRAAE